MGMGPGTCGARWVGGGAQEQAPRARLKAAGRLGKHQPTQPVAEGVGVGIRRLHHGAWLTRSAQ